ncbi:hypothetical protein GCM10027280_60390 [Micromonospora polyrhachis]|uniref:Peptidase inhibitor family I36 n=1 Tax=Micromonospora polyrhachis TaxID=1282883 RepID=A0A7W7SV91_9ACTN|nr:hypothetical protein [Micromonospora polyrhachis]
MRRFSIRKLIASMSVAVVAAGLAIGVGAAPAQAGGTTGWYSLCARGTYTSYMKYSDSPTTSVLAHPGSCVPIYLDGSRVDIYGLYPGGYEFHVGTNWWPANIATTGNMGSWGWYVY